MKSIVMYILCCIFASSIVAQTVQIDSISGSQIYLPVYTNGLYSYSQQIIEKNKVIENGWSESAGNITRIRYHFNDLESLINSNNWKIYLGETDKNFFATNEDWELIENMTLVYDGFITDPVSSGWYDIMLQTPFSYDGERNLIIAIDENSANGIPSHTYYSSYYDTVNSGLVFYSQGGGAINPDPLSPPAGNLKSSVPVLQFYFEEICSSPTGFTLTNLNATSADFAWVSQGTESSWNLRYKPTNGTSWTTISELNTTAYSLTDLFSIESYIVQVQANCIGSTSEWINPIYFTTPEIPGFEHTVDWEIFKNRTEGDFSIVRDTIPDLVIKLDSIFTPDYSTGMDRFFSRIRGYIIPRTSGEFSFHFGCNDIGEFWLSTDESEANSVLAISYDTIQTDLTLNQYLQNLIEGNKYYFEIVHYDTVFNDLIQLGWTLPGDTMITTLKTPFISSCGTSIPAQNLNFLNPDITGYPGSEHPIICRFTPWNVSDKSINWLSTDENTATVDESGIVTLVSEGSCRIIGVMADNVNATDTLNINVWNYPGPFFVKPGAAKNSNGQNWENAIDLQTLLKILNTRIDNQIITVYASGGLYKPTETIDRNVRFLINNVRFVGGFNELSVGTDTTQRDINLNETKLSGDIGVLNESIDNSYHVVYIGGKSLGLGSGNQITDNSILDGIVIQDGRASCSTHGRDFSVSWRQDDLGGGIFVKFAHLKMNNCTIRNCISWNSGAALYSMAGNGKRDSIFIYNCIVENNQTLQELMTSGGIISVVVNVYGAGMAFTSSIAFVENSIFRYNHAMSQASAIYCAAATAYIDGSSFYGNTGGAVGDIYSTGSSIINLNNVTCDGSVMTFRSNANIHNSTISKGFYSWYPSLYLDGYRNIDNSLISEFVTNDSLGDPNLNIQYCIISNKLFGTSLYDTISVAIPELEFLLDSISDNGGPTPTMKLKNIPGNYAMNYGNPMYLDSTDQRGAIRANFVSIGAYQWVNATEIVISPNQLTLTQGDSIDFEVYFLPAFSSNGLYTVSCSDNSIARLDSSTIYAMKPGFVNIIAQSVDGTMRDTLVCHVIANEGIEEVNKNKSFIVYPNPVKNELIIESKGIAGIIKYEILNNFGQMVYKGSFTGQTIINTSILRSGMYLIKCRSEKGVELMKVLKK